MHWLYACFVLLVATAHATDEAVLELANGDEISIEQHAASGDQLILWLPSEFGLSPRQQPTSEALTRFGVEVWIPDLHAAWFIPPGRYSLNQVDPGVISQLIKKALGSGKQVTLMASGRVNALALYAVRRLQTGNTDLSHLRGLIAISPRLYRQTPNGGKAAEFLPIASASNLPIFLLQPREAGAFWRVADVMQQLETGGSPVFLQLLDKVGDGFNLRPEFTDAEAAMTQRLPTLLKQALQQLAALPATPNFAAPMQGEEIAPSASQGAALLKPYPGQRLAPALQLPDLAGQPITLAKRPAPVMLVNFWATWCPPCVEEIPSLQRLYRRFHAQGLDILAVDVGESAESVRQFLSDKPVEFSVLLDEQGKALKDWGVHAFPTTLVLDSERRIRFAVFGAFDWDSPEVHRTLRPLLEAAPATSPSSQ